MEWEREMAKSERERWPSRKERETDGQVKSGRERERERERWLCKVGTRKREMAL